MSVEQLERASHGRAENGIRAGTATIEAHSLIRPRQVTRKSSSSAVCAQLTNLHMVGCKRSSVIGNEVTSKRCLQNPQSSISFPNWLQSAHACWDGLSQRRKGTVPSEPAKERLYSRLNVKWQVTFKEAKTGEYAEPSHPRCHFLSPREMPSFCHPIGGTVDAMDGIY